MPRTYKAMISHMAIIGHGNGLLIVMRSGCLINIFGSRESPYLEIAGEGSVYKERAGGVLPLVQ